MSPIFWLKCPGHPEIWHLSLMGWPEKIRIIKFSIKTSAIHFRNFFKPLARNQCRGVCMGEIGIKKKRKRNQSFYNSSNCYIRVKKRLELEKNQLLVWQKCMWRWLNTRTSLSGYSSMFFIFVNFRLFFRLEIPHLYFKSCSNKIRLDIMRDQYWTIKLNYFH